MKDHEIILKMIEEVDPKDTAKLDEIDGRVFCYIKELDPLMKMPSVWPYPMWKDPTAQRVDYTRSRDALKAIRPEGWFYNIGHNESNSGGLFACSMYSHTNSPLKNSPDLPTEELAELHAIIQAIAYEREMI